MSYEKIVTLFDTAQHAEAAKSNLAKAGFSTDNLSIVSGAELPKSGNALREPGLWHRLFGGEIEQHEAEVYGKAVETGGVVLTVRAEDAEVPRAMGILNQHNMVEGVAPRRRTAGSREKVSRAGNNPHSALRNREARRSLRHPARGAR